MVMMVWWFANGSATFMAMNTMPQRQGVASVRLNGN